MITLEKGLKNSLIVLEHLRNNEELCALNITVGTFVNCREQGLTFVLFDPKPFTWCIYEHRNGDNIIINGKKGYICRNGELPYMADSKYEYLGEFEYNQHEECADSLANMMLEHSNIKSL